MNENVKTFSLAVITICVFVMAVIDVLQLVDRKKHGEDAHVHSRSDNNHEHDKAITNQPKTTIRFDEEQVDFGTIVDGDVRNHTFSFTNTGSNPLIITNAVGSCGCTVPTYPKEPIAPGQSASIEIQFNSAGKAGEQNKTVTITANTDPPPPVLHVLATVEKKE